MIDFNIQRENVLIDLHDHKGTWRSAKDLAGAHGFPIGNNQYELRQQLAIAIKHGVPIISGSKGFMWAKQSNQVKRYEERLRSRANEILRRADDVAKVREQLEAEEKMKETLG